jgi:hypothetical protein
VPLVPLLFDTCTSYAPALIFVGNVKRTAVPFDDWIFVWTDTTLPAEVNRFTVLPVVVKFVPVIVNVPPGWLLTGFTLVIVGDGRLNIAETEVLALTVTVQVGEVPEHAPPQPAKVELAPGVAVRATGNPFKITVEHTPPQLMVPPGTCPEYHPYAAEPDIVPAPDPDLETDTVYPVVYSWLGQPLLFMRPTIHPKLVPLLGTVV